MDDGEVGKGFDDFQDPGFSGWLLPPWHAKPTPSPPKSNLKVA